MRKYYKAKYKGETIRHWYIKDQEYQIWISTRSMGLYLRKVNGDCPNQFFKTQEELFQHWNLIEEIPLSQIP